jgi:hypothetical protein
VGNYASLSVFFFSFLQSSLWGYICTACGAQLANTYICWEFFLAQLPNYLSPSGYHFIVKVKFLALLSDLKEKKSDYVSN